MAIFNFGIFGEKAINRNFFFREKCAEIFHLTIAETVSTSAFRRFKCQVRSLKKIITDIRYNPVTVLLSECQ